MTPLNNTILRYVSIHTKLLFLLHVCAVRTFQPMLKTFFTHTLYVQLCISLSFLYYSGNEYVVNSSWIFLAFILNVTWYAIRERVRGRSIPFIWINRPLRLTVKMVGVRRSSYMHLVPCSLLNERSLGQSSGVTWRGGGRGKVGWLVHRLFAPKRPACVKEIWRRNSVWKKPASEADRCGQPAPGRSLTRKKKRKKFEKLKTRQR